MSNALSKVPTHDHTDASVGASVDRYEQQVARLVRDELGAVAALKRVLFVPKLPKTRSGKIARSTLAAMANQKPYKVCHFVQALFNANACRYR